MAYLTIDDLDHAATPLTGNERVELSTGESATTQAIADLAGGGGGGVVLESYQNSAMSAAVQAYVFRDESDNIYRVYEPIRNNDVSNGAFLYTDSTARFPFDNVDWENNLCNGLSLTNLGSTTGISVKNNIFFRGLLQGDIGGVGLSISQCNVFGSTISFFDKNNVLITACNFSQDSQIKIRASDISVEYMVLGNNAVLSAWGSSTNSYLNTYANVGDDSAGFSIIDRCMFFQQTTVLGSGELHDSSFGISAYVSASTYNLVKCQIPNNVEFTPSENQTNKNIANIGGTVYELGVTAGAVTATAV